MALQESEVYPASLSKEQKASAQKKAAQEKAKKTQKRGTAKTEPRATEKNDADSKNMGQTLSIGYTSYCVHRAWWSNRLSQNRFLDKRANANWLFLEISVRNDDTKARTIPPFTLIDENGAEYETSTEAAMIENSIGMFDSLNPSVTKQGVLVFDVPRNHEYRLKVSGGYWSDKVGFICFNPHSE